jgi:hypothetical protein
MVGTSAATSKTKGRAERKTTSPASFCPMPVRSVCTSSVTALMTRVMLDTSTSRSSVASFSL